MNETLGNTDQIYGAYKGTLGEDLMLSTRERFTWQSSMVKGNKVLDIGCSQGILPILLAREGKEVYGMDIMEDAIKFAHDLKSQEHLKVQERITFVNEDYNQSEIDKVFDTVILGEIIEHLFYPQNLIKKVLKNLSSGGRVVITVPFGINDYYDHRKTYYLYDLLELLKNDFDIVEIHYSDIRESTNWIGIVADKRRYSQKNADVIPFPWLEELEKHFYKREKLLTRQINEQKEENQKLKLQYDELANASEYFRNRKIVKLTDSFIKTIKRPFLFFKSKWKILKNHSWFLRRNTLGIIISTRKDEKTPLNQTQAFLSLSRLEKFENIRIIFLSNCYKEGTAMGLEDYPNVKIEAMDTTLSSAMQIINSKYISILESDSPIPVDLYEEGIEKMNRNPKIQIVFLSSIMRGEKQVKEIDDNFLVKQSISDEIFGEDKRSLCISNLLLRNGKIRRYLAQRYVYSRGWEIFQFYNLLLNSELSLGLRKKITTKQIFNNQKIDFKLERKWHQAFVDYLSKHDLLKKFKKFVKPINLRNLYAGYFSNINEEQRNILEEGLRDVLSIYRYILEKSFSQEILSKIPDSNGSSYYKNSGLDIAIITDTFAYKYFEDAANLHYVNKENYKDVLGRKKIDMLLFVTCWYGMKNNDWVGIAGDPIVKQKTLEIFNHAKKRKIPVVFWSKEDPTNYEIFLEYAKASDYIFTTAEECINEYKKDTGNKDVYLLKYGVNPFIHNPIGFRLKNKNGDQNVILFAGTWYPQTPAYKERIKDQEMLFDGVLASKSKELVVIDRNFFKYEQYEYPMQYWNYIYPSVEYGNIQKIRKLFDLAINLNIVKDSKTMCAARVYELQAMGVAIISNYSKAVKKNFTNISIPNNKREVTQVINKSHGIELFKRQVEGIRNMFTQNTVFDRIGEMITAMGKSAPISGILPVTVVCEEINPQIEKMFQKQKYENKVLLEVKDIENLNSKFVTFFSEKYMYGQNYLQDLVNGFKFTDVFYVTKGVIDLKKDPNMSDFHHYVSSVSDKYRTMYNLKKLSFKRILKEEKLEELGYVIDPFEITTKK